MGILISKNEAVNAQNQIKADSLKLVLHTDKNLEAKEQMKILESIAIFSSNPDEVIQYAENLIALANKSGNTEYIAYGYYHKGCGYRLKGDLNLALENLFKCASLADKHNNKKSLAEAYTEISTTYSLNNDLKNATEYNEKAFEILRNTGQYESLGLGLLNNGYNFYELKNYEKALANYNEAEVIFNTYAPLEIGKAYTIGNRALVFWKQGDSDRAEKDILKAIGMLAQIGDDYGMADYQNQLGTLYLEKGNTQLAIKHINKGIELAEELHLKEQIRDGAQILTRLYKNNKDFENAFHYQNLYFDYRDSIENTETIKKMANLKTEFEVSLKDKEIGILEKSQLLNRAYITIAIFLLVLSVITLLYFRQRWKNSKLIAENQKKKHAETIKELLSTQETKALQSMVKGQENERKRLAQELHNHFGSLLATIKVNLNAVEDYALPNYDTLSSLIDHACTDVRNLSHSLNVGISEDFGLIPALKELTSHLKSSNNIQVEFAASMGECQLDSDMEIVIYRIIQELISNVLKHANASRLAIQLTYVDEEDLINIIVEDNGKGFNYNTIEPNKSGIGLQSLSKMIHNLHGEISFDSNSLTGTTISIDIPVNLFD